MRGNITIGISRGIISIQVENASISCIISVTSEFQHPVIATNTLYNFTSTLEKKQQKQQLILQLKRQRARRAEKLRLERAEESLAIRQKTPAAVALSAPPPNANTRLAEVET